MDYKEIQHIILKISKGDQTAFTKIVTSYQNLVYGLSLKMCQSESDAAEVSQETFIKVYKNLPSFKGQAKLSTWIYRITYFTAINYLKKNQKLVEEPLKEEVYEDPTDVLNELNHQSQKEYINKALNRLSPQERAIITCFYLEELTIKETAEITGLSIANTKIKLHRTRSKLKTILSQLLPKEANMLY